MIPDFSSINTNPTATSENVPEIEQQIRVIKERAWSIRSTMTFKRIPKWIIIKLLKFVVMWLNDLPVKSRVSSTLSPRTIITGNNLDCKKHCRAESGAFWEVHEENRLFNNINNDRTRSAICLGTTTNFQVSYTFLCLTTGKCIT